MMAFDSKNLDDYIDVTQRLADFREQYPHGSVRPLNPAEPWRMVQIQGFEKNGDAITQTFIVYVAEAYRTPDDPRPGVGSAWEVFPGRTPYTRGSELMNAETSAWGRAIVAALASDTKRGVASREEVRNRSAEREGPTEGSAAGPAEAGSTPGAGPSAAAILPERTRTQVTGAEHERLRNGAAQGYEPAAQHLPVTPSDDPWYDAGEPGTPLPEVEGRPGTISREQSREMHALFGQLGIKDRAKRLAVTEEIIGRPVPTSNMLSHLEAGKVLLVLRERAKAPADAS